MYTNANLAIFVPADGLTPTGARPSAVAALTAKIGMICWNFIGFGGFMHVCWSDDLFQRDQWDHVKSRGIHRQTSNISHTLVGNVIVDNSDVVGASPVGSAPTTFSLST